jgi:hypothetical protein
LDEDELSEALLDLTNTQLYPKRWPKRRKRVYEPVKSQPDAEEGPVVGEERWESDNDGTVVTSPSNLLND